MKYPQKALLQKHKGRNGQFKVDKRMLISTLSKRWQILIQSNSGAFLQNEGSVKGVPEWN